MKNITLSVDDKDLETLRVYAAERKTTVNALVRDYIAQLARQRTRAQDAMARLRTLSEQTQARLGPGYRFDRNSTHDR